MANNIKNQKYMPILKTAVWIHLLFATAYCISRFTDFNTTAPFEIYMSYLLLPLLQLASAVILVLYICRLYTKPNSYIYPCIAVGVLLLRRIYPLVNAIIRLNAFAVIYNIVDCLIIVAFAVWIYKKANGMPDKLYKIISLSLVVIWIILDVFGNIDVFGYINGYLSLYIYVIINSLYEISLFALLFILGKSNLFYIPIKINPDDEIEAPAIILKNLKHKMELGFITEEEFQAQKEELLKKL